MRTWGIELEVSCILIGWRDAMRDIRAGFIPESRESIHRLAARTLMLLTDVERSHAGDPPEARRMAAELISEARAEVQGATFHDLADSREQAG